MLTSLLKSQCDASCPCWGVDSGRTQPPRFSPSAVLGAGFALNRHPSTGTLSVSAARRSATTKNNNQQQNNCSVHGWAVCPGISDTSCLCNHHMWRPSVSAVSARIARTALPQIQKWLRVWRYIGTGRKRRTRWHPKIAERWETRRTWWREIKGQ